MLLGIHCHHTEQIPEVSVGNPPSVPGTENVFCAQAVPSLEQLILLARTSTCVDTIYQSPFY